MSAEQSKTITREVMELVFNKRDANRMLDFLAPDFVEHTPFKGQDESGRGLASGLESLFKAFPDLVCTIDELIAESDSLVIRGTMKGTHMGDYLGLPATGKCMAVQGVDILHFKDGKITEHWGFYDYETMMSQLGVEAQPGAISFLQAPTEQRKV